MNDVMSKIWKDPVLSKVLATIIIASAAATWNITNKYSFNYQVPVPAWIIALFLAAMIIGIRLYLKANKLLKLEKGKYNQSDITQKLTSFENEIIQCLNESKYFTKCQQAQHEHPDSDYSSYIVAPGLISSLSDFFRKQLNQTYETRHAELNIRTRNVILSDLNTEFPDTYKQLLDLFQENHCNKSQIQKCFQLKR